MEFFCTCDEEWINTPDGSTWQYKALFDSFQKRVALVVCDDPGIFKHHHLTQEKLLPVFFIKEIVAFHFIELQLKLHKITAVNRFQRRNQVHHLFNVLIKLTTLIPFKIHKRQIPLLVVEFILQIEQHDFVKFIKAAFGMRCIRTKLKMPILACLHQLLEPFQKYNAINILFIIKHGFTALLYEAPVIGTCPDHVKHKIVGLLLYGVFFQDKR